MKMKNVSDRLICRMDMTKERINELENVSKTSPEKLKKN